MTESILYLLLGLVSLFIGTSLDNYPQLLNLGAIFVCTSVILRRINELKNKKP